jgi:hypothetical protein
MTELVKHNEKDLALAEQVLFAINCYDICTENRNILLHATNANTNYETMVIELRKRASKNPLRELQFEVPLELLRRVADEMSQTLEFVSALWYFQFQKTNPYAHEQVPLPEKPPNPHKLTPSQPGATPQVEAIPPQSSEA